ncbi:MAG: bifunctional diaminohydroxyphosphoribosylaminopyrimidine deaminase/5-amino-6-(5-phosphoribosylamino)uracil reductase RibD [Burkholderiales bacterium]|nr:bifunctional diaminohydroxyphosphoribosylaminopyrimidine deaminase/5-amino-6-(5-phosphoribosylamino)uracil reductase RibD [Burkholderiales bacterium]
MDPLSELDHSRLQKALALAEHSIGLSEPNPRVGCIVGHADGRVIGQGWTREAGGPHAEVVALREAAAAGADTRGATAWVTLEPCAHHGRTPPCCDALLDAGITRVVIAVGDPFPQVAGAGIARLRAAGVGVDLLPADDPAAIAARELNIGFFSRVVRGRPWVRVKVAASLDGRTALPDGQSQWITDAEARADGHAWRKRAGAILTGVGTVLADDPRLDVRLVATTLQPLRVIVDSRLRSPARARILAEPGRALVATIAPQATPSAAALAAHGVELLHLQAQGDGRVELGALLRALASRGINELHVEAGSTLNGALHAGGWVDEWLLYLAPMLLGPGRDIARLPALASLSSAPRLRFVDLARVGEDLRLRARPTGREAFASPPARS